MKKPPFTLDAIVFDFDGTMAPLNVDFMKMRRCAIEYLSSYGIPEEILQERFILEMIENARAFIARKNDVQANDMQHEAMRLIQEIELDAAAEARLFPSTEAMLRELKERKIRTGVVTRNCRAALETVFPEIYTAVDIVLTRDHIERVKPDPEHLRQALAYLGVLPAKAAMIGDHPMDVQLGLAAGATAIGVLTGSTGKAKLEAAGADWILEQAPDIVALLK